MVTGVSWWSNFVLWMTFRDPCAKQCAVVPSRKRTGCEMVERCVLCEGKVEAFLSDVSLVNSMSPNRIGGGVALHRFRRMESGAEHGGTVAAICSESGELKFLGEEERELKSVDVLEFL